MTAPEHLIIISATSGPTRQTADVAASEAIPGRYQRQSEYAVDIAAITPHRGTVVGSLSLSGRQ